MLNAGFSKTTLFGSIGELIEHDVEVEGIQLFFTFELPLLFF